MKKLMSIKISSLTPIMLGGYNTFLDYIVRPTTLRGILRWWLRAIIAGAAIHLNKDPVDAVKRIVPKCLGGTEEESKSSRIKILVEGNIIKLRKKLWKEIRPREGREFRVSINFDHQRMQLLYMAIDKDILKELDIKSKKDFERKKRDFEDKLLERLSEHVGSIKEARLEIYTFSSKIDIEDQLICMTLILALLFNGIGKGARRGLGAVKITEINLHDKVIKDAFLEILPNLERPTFNPEILKRLIQKTLDIAKDVVRKQKENIKDLAIRDLPPIPALHQEFAKIYIINTNGKDLYDIICEINKVLFLRQHPMGLGIKLRGIKNPRQAVRVIGHYILGLPRSARGRTRDGIELNIHASELKFLQQNLIRKIGKTGIVYFRNNEEARRASPIILSAIDDYKVSIVMFISKDWPKTSPNEKLIWLTTKPLRGRRISIPRLKEAYDMVQAYIERKLGSVIGVDRINRIFP